MSPCWWTRRAARSSAAAGGTPSASTCRPTCPWSWPTGSAWCRCSTTCSPTPRAGLRAHPDRGGARGAGCGGLGRRRGPGHRAGPARPAVPQIHHRRGPEGRPRQRAGPRHLQGPGRGPGGAHPGRERRRRPRRALSPSRSRWPRRPATVPPRPAPARRATPRTQCPSSWSTTTRRRCAISATRWRRRATPRWSPATQGRWRASSRPKSPNWSCST